jgi:hypothetical protein
VEQRRLKMSSLVEVFEVEADNREGVKTTARVKSPWRRETGMSTLKVP